MLAFARSSRPRCASTRVRSACTSSRSSPAACRARPGRSCCAHRGERPACRRPRRRAHRRHPDPGQRGGATARGGAGRNRAGERRTRCCATCSCRWSADSPRPSATTPTSFSPISARCSPPPPRWCSAPAAAEGGPQPGARPILAISGTCRAAMSSPVTRKRRMASSAAQQAQHSRASASAQGTGSGHAGTAGTGCSICSVRSR